MYGDCLLNSETGTELMVNKLSSEDLYKGGYYWSYYGAQRTILRTTVDHDGDKTGSMYKAIKSIRQISTDVRGTYLADVTAVVNSLPSDGKHTDGYWYVFKNLVEE